MIEVELETLVGKVKGAFIPQDEYQVWLDAHPDSVVINTAPFVFVVHQELPSH